MQLCNHVINISDYRVVPLQNKVLCIRQVGNCTEKADQVLLYMVGTDWRGRGVDKADTGTEAL